MNFVDLDSTLFMKWLVRCFYDGYVMSFCFDIYDILICDDPLFTCDDPLHVSWMDGGWMDGGSICAYQFSISISLYA